MACKSPRSRVLHGRSLELRPRAASSRPPLGRPQAEVGKERTFRDCRDHRSLGKLLSCESTSARETRHVEGTRRCTGAHGRDRGTYPGVHGACCIVGVMDTWCP
eukprot:4928288-Prymnesium_polylepis.1